MSVNHKLARLWKECAYKPPSLVIRMLEHQKKSMTQLIRQVDAQIGPCSGSNLESPMVEAVG